MKRLTGLAALANFGKQAVMVPLRKGLDQRRAAQTLQQLPGHLLADIGLSPADIPAAVYGSNGRPSMIASLWRGLMALLAVAKDRRATIRTLSGMPDRLLADIGIERDNIDMVVDNLVAARTEVAERMAAEMPLPLEAIAARLDGLVRSFRQWNISRKAAGEMARIDGKLMTDIGYVKGDVDWVPEVLTERRLSGVNDSHAPHKAA
jgi:uncharacterized protein YjiS (DUF1127 family)